MTRRPALLGFGALLLVAVAVVVVVLATGSGTSSSEDVATSILAPTGANLIVNGSAQVGATSVQGWDAVTIPGWRVLSGLPTVVESGTRGFPAVSGSTGARVPSTGAREDASAAGARLFVGGAGGTARLTQLIPLLSADRRSLPAGTTYQLSASLAGTATSSASLKLALLSGSGRVLAARKLGPAGEDALQGAARTGGVPALPAHLGGALPAGTVAARVTLVLSTSLRDVDGPDAPLAGYNRAVATRLQLSLAAPTRQLPLTPPAGHVPRYEHVFLFYFENQDYRAIIGNTMQAPFINSLLRHASLLANLYAEEHPSDGNYLALEGGSTFGVPLDDPLEENNLYTIHARELGAELDGAGVSWAYYLQGAEGPCDDTVHGYYWDDDLMPMYFASIRDRPAYCAAHVLPLERTVPDLVLTQTTPSFAWIGADDCDDMEGCGIRAGDSFLEQQLGAIMRSPAWRTQRSLAIITFDEDAYDNERPAQRVATIVIGSRGVRAGYVSRVRYTHYSLLRTIEDALGLAALTANDRWAQPLNDVFSASADDGWLPPAASHGTAATPAPTTTPIQVPDGTTAEIAHARAAHAAWLAEVARCRSAPRGAPTAFVVNSGAGTVTPIDLLSGRARRSIAVGADPQAISITPDGRMALVVNAGSSSVTPIDTVSLKAGPPIPVGSDPRAIAITRDGRTALVANSGSNSVTPIDLAAWSTRAPIAVGVRPRAIAISPVGHTAYVLDWASASVTPVDTSTGYPGPPIATGAYPVAAAFSHDGATAYVAGFGSDTVTAIDVATGEPKAAIHTGAAPDALALSPDGSTLYVLSGDTDSLTPIDAATLLAGTPIRVGYSPAALMITDSGLAWALNTIPGTLMPIAVRLTGVAPEATGAGRSISLGGSTYPIALALAPGGQIAVVVDTGSGQVTVVDLRTRRSSPPISTGLNPVAVAITP